MGTDAGTLREADLIVLDGLVSALVETRKGIAAFQALETSLLASAMALGVDRSDASRSDGDMPLRAIAAEVGAALRVSDRTVQRRLGEASRLATRFPVTLAALTEGRISRAHVDVIVDAGERLDEDERIRFETAAIAVAERETAARLRPIARLLAERLMPQMLSERHAAARESRCVDVRDLDDGMSQLLAVLPSTLAHGIRSRLTAMATAVADADAAEERTVDQLRADLLADLALTADPQGLDERGLVAEIRAVVHVTVPALTLAREDGDAAMLEGSAPIDIDTARLLCAGETSWERVLTHPVTQAVLAVDTYRPTAELRRLLRARDQRCRFPGCRVPAHRCDLDHVHDHALGGATAQANLAHECRRHHVLKHHSAWTVVLHPDRTMTWTSPTGREYPDAGVPPGVAFTDDGESPPF
ncbi:DUF222 domain-containing protein [Planococcus sp. APC 4015]|nr:DUF222 domain-containing protein [Planococcus sp. APC 4015]